MRIEDDELRELFKTSSQERLAAIDAGLLRLEKQPDNMADNLETLEALMREAHSLKGDGNMLGLKDLGTLAHQVEHIFKTLQQQEQGLTPELCDRLAHGLDAIRKLAQEAVTGEPSQVDVFYVLAELMGATPRDPDMQPTTCVEAEDTRSTTPVEVEDMRSTTSASAGMEDMRSTTVVSDSHIPSHNGNTFGTQVPVANALDAPHNGSTPVSEPAYRIETIRVSTQQLDRLMTDVGELAVTQSRVSHRLIDIEAITKLWETWNRDLFVQRMLFVGESSQGNNGFPHPSRQPHSSSSIPRQQLQLFYQRMEQMVQQLGQRSQHLRNALSEDVTRLETISDQLETGISQLRLLPLGTMFNLFPRMVRDLARREGKQVELVIQGGETLADKRILEEMKDPILHLLRNAIDHGIEPPAIRQQQNKPAVATLILSGYQTANHVVIEVQDDGRGLDLEAIKTTAIRRGVVRSEELDTLTEGQIQALILKPGFSTRQMVTELSGRGVGLDVVQTNVQNLKGSIEIESVTGQGCKIRVRLSTTLATVQVLIVSVQGRPYGLPIEAVSTTCFVDRQARFNLQGHDTFLHNDQPVSLASLADLLEFNSANLANPVSSSSISSSSKTARQPCILLQIGSEKLGVLVDELLDAQAVILKPQSQLLKRVRNVAGATILGTGEVCIVLNPQDLIASAKGRRTSPSPQTPVPQVRSKLSILLVEDSIATRTQEKRILEAAGYAVTTAVDGLDGFNKLRLGQFDAIVSDIQMPKLDGLGLTERVRQHPEYREIPIVLVTTLASEDDRRRGAEAGANAYLTKGSFSQDTLLETLRRLI